MDQNIILKMNRIRKTFPGVVALDNVNFELYEGEVHVLLGENGAGKSTLVKILSGAYNKTDGEIFFKNQKIEIENPKRSQQLGIAIIYQELNLVRHLTAGENIFLGREPVNRYGIINQKKLYRDAQKILDDLGVKISARSLVFDIGLAQQQVHNLSIGASSIGRVEVIVKLVATFTAVILEV